VHLSEAELLVLSFQSTCCCTCHWLICTKWTNLCILFLFRVHSKRCIFIQEF